MNDDLDAALDEVLRRFAGEWGVAMTMRTPKLKEQWTNATVAGGVEAIKKVFAEGPPERSPFRRTRKGWGLLNGAGEAGEGQGGPSTEPDLRLVE
jgi:hypothetical protein